MRYSKKYHPNSFYVEVGFKQKGRYYTRYNFSCFTPDRNAEALAIMNYNAINIGLGYKKRLLYVNENGVCTIKAHYQS